MKRYIKFIMCFLLIFSYSAYLLSFPVNSEENESEITLNSDIALIVNMDTDVVLFDKNSRDRISCGFLERIMTCVLLLESEEDFEQKITITDEMLKQTPQISSANLVSGNEVSLNDLARCVLVGNSQEACVAIALTLGGTADKFIDMMNERAKELGAENTLFTSFHGYYTRESGYTTLIDAAKIIKYALTLENFESFCNQIVIKINVSGKPRLLYTRNNIIVPSSQYYIKKATGICAYSSGEAGSTAVNMTTSGGMKLLSLAVSLSDIIPVYQDMQVMLKHSAEKYLTVSLITKNTAVREILVKMGRSSDHVVLVAQETLKAVLPDYINVDDIEKTISVPESISAPVEKGVKVGTMTFSYQDNVYGTVNLIAQSSVELDMIQFYTDKINSIFSSLYFWIILGVIVIMVILYALLTVRINRNKINKSRRKDKDRIKIDID